MKILKKLIKKILGKNFFYNGFYEIDSSLEGLTSILDLGCGDNSPYLRYWIKNNHNSIGVDLYANKYFSKNYKIIQKDVIDFVKLQSDKSFDAVLALDIIEHFEKSDALFLIKEIERIAKKKIIIVTPNGFWPGMLSGPGQTHLCGFTYDEFRKFGYQVWGGGGLACLRSKKNSYLKCLNFKNTLPLQLIIFNIGNLFVKQKPELAYGLLAIKNIK